MSETIHEACAAAGLTVVGPTVPDIGLDGGVVVAHPFTSAKLDHLDEARWRTVPTGHEHTIVVPRSKRSA